MKFHSGDVKGRTILFVLPAAKLQSKYLSVQDEEQYSCICQVRNSIRMSFQYVSYGVFVI